MEFLKVNIVESVRDFLEIPKIGRQKTTLHHSSFHSLHYMGGFGGGAEWSPFDTF